MTVAVRQRSEASCAACEARFAALEQRIAALEATRPRDAEDADLRRQLATNTRHPENDGPLPFRSGDLVGHAKHHAPPLHRALLAAGIQTGGELGCWLRAQIGTRDGVRIARHGSKRWLATWAT